jgi:hypothetical protein
MPIDALNASLNAVSRPPLSPATPGIRYNGLRPRGATATAGASVAAACLEVVWLGSVIAAVAGVLPLVMMLHR